jgi:hypothetical protein
MRPHYYNITAKARYDDPIQYVTKVGKPTYHPGDGATPRHIAFVNVSVVAYSEAEAAARFREEHVPLGAASVTVLSVHRAAPFDITTHKEMCLANRQEI